MEEFGEACELLRKHLPEHDTKEQLMDMCKMMDINKDGLVDLNEFLETFRLCEQGRIKLTIIDEHKTKINPEVSIVISDCDSLNVDENNLNSNNKKATTSNGHNGRKKETAIESDESDDIDVDDNDVDKDQRKTTIGTNGNVIQKSSSASTTSSISNKKDDSPKKQRVKLKDMYL